jgi:NitT/TauT family transport system substrate-binding protein
MFKRLLFVAAWASVVLVGSSRVYGQDKVIFGMDFTPYGTHALFWPGLDQGFYERSGLTVSILRGYGSGDTAKRVDVGTAAFGFADSGASLVAISKGANIKIVGMVHHHPPHGIVTLKDRGISRPGDLQGRTIGASAGDANRLLFPVFAERAGFDPEKVKWVTMGPEAYLPSLLAGRVDAASAFHTDLPRFIAAARTDGKEAVYLPYRDSGFDIYSSALITSRKLLAENPDLARRFIAATYKSIQWAIDNPEGAVRSLIKHNPELRAELEREALKTAISLFGPQRQSAREAGLGMIDRTKMERTIGMLVKYMKIPAVNPEDAFTNEFLAK